jgi:hypothetical protein
MFAQVSDVMHYGIVQYEPAWKGERPIRLNCGRERMFVDDGDTVVLRRHCEKAGLGRVGFGECVGMVPPAFNWLFWIIIHYSFFIFANLIVKTAMSWF